MVVNFVRDHWAEPGVTVTESKSLHDDDVKVDREVDVVEEISVDGEPVVTSIEVTETGRRVGIQRAEQLIAKHQRLPTRHLIIVSQKGFAKSALALIDKERRWVTAARPELVEDFPGDPRTVSHSPGFRPPPLQNPVFQDFWNCNHQQTGLQASATDTSQQSVGHLMPRGTSSAPGRLRGSSRARSHSSISVLALKVLSMMLRSVLINVPKVTEPEADVPTSRSLRGECGSSASKVSSV
jgi:hypothetical protein